MRTKLFLGIALLGMLLAGGCGEGHLYPVRGPFASQSPAPVFTARMRGGFQSGNISVVLASGERAVGRWEWTRTELPASQESSDHGAASESMTSVWDAVYGQGFYVSRVMGRKPFARAELTGNSGTTLQMEMYRPVGEGGDAPDNFKGVARDSKGNVYKVIF